MTTYEIKMIFMSVLKSIETNSNCIDDNFGIPYHINAIYPNVVNKLGVFGRESVTNIALLNAMLYNYKSPKINELNLITDNYTRFHHHLYAPNLPNDYKYLVENNVYDINGIVSKLKAGYISPLCFISIYSVILKHELPELPIVAVRYRRITKLLKLIHKTVKGSVYRPYTDIVIDNYMID